MIVEYNTRPMKILISVIIISFITFPITIYAQEKPSAEVISNDTTICESGNVNFVIKLKGSPPFSISYEYDGSTGTEDPTHLKTMTYNLPFSEIQKPKVILKAVYDSNYPPHGGESGDIIGDGEMVVMVYKMPTVNAGSDDDICGYDYDLKGEISGETTKVWWTDPSSEGSFDNYNSLTSKFTGDNANTYTLNLNVENGVCETSDEVEITIKGRPTGAFTDGTTWDYCSSDGIADKIPINLNFTGVQDFTYFLKNDLGDDFGPFTSALNTDMQLISVSETETISLKSIEDGQGCTSLPSDMLGSKTANDVKPTVFAGDDATICGESYELTANVSPNTNGEWTTKSTGIEFENDKFNNSITNATIDANVLYKDAILKWTETTTDEFNCAHSDEVRIKFVRNPTFKMESSSKDNICDGESSFLQYSLTGSTPLSINYRDENNRYIENSINSLTGILELASPFDTSEENESTNSKTEYTIIKITDGFGCFTDLDKEYTVTVDEMPYPFAGDDEEKCSKQITLSAEIPPVGIGTWSGPGNFEDENNALSVFTANNFDENPGEVQTLTWTVTNGECVASDQVDISFHKAPYPIGAGNDTTIYAIDFVQLNALLPEDGNSYSWSFIEDNTATLNSPDDPKTILSNLQTGKYELLWTVSLTEGDCPDKTDTVTITVKNLLAPTGISPNGDGINDVLKIKGAENIPNDKLTVFNKHGKKVFTANEYQNNWGGKDLGGSDLPCGTYFYVYEGDNSSPIKNYLIIKR